MHTLRDTHHTQNVAINFYNMIKSVIVSLLLCLTISCSDNNQAEETTVTIERLQKENDSLKKIISEVNNKYVFDSISVRDIPSFKNRYELNSEITGEIVFVGYNLNNESHVVKFDSVNYENGRTLYNPDTLQNVKGGYRYTKILTSEVNTFHADLKTENTIGKPFYIVYHTAISTGKN